MSTLPTFWVALTLGLGVAAAWVETTGRSGYGVLKMAAASGYLGFALQQGALGSVYGQVVLLALLLSWIGDLLLVGGSRLSFIGGLGAFLLAHLAYSAAFGIRGVMPLPVAVGAVGMLVVGALVLGWLRKAGLPPGMRAPVVAYLAAIGLMVAMALGAGAPRVVAGAVAFAASDIFVARQRFVVPAAINRRVGLPLYFVGQLLLAGTV